MPEITNFYNHYDLLKHPRVYKKNLNQTSEISLPECYEIPPHAYSFMIDKRNDLKSRGGYWIECFPSPDGDAQVIFIGTYSDCIKTLKRIACIFDKKGIPYRATYKAWDIER